MVSATSDRVGHECASASVQFDDPMQSAQSHALVRTQGVGGCYLNAIVLSEFAWTLARSYKELREVIAAHLASLLAAPEFVVGHSEEASRALGRYLSGRADFPDYFLGRDQ